MLFAYRKNLSYTPLSSPAGLFGASKCQTKNQKAQWKVKNTSSLLRRVPFTVVNSTAQFNLVTAAVAPIQVLQAAIRKRRGLSTFRSKRSLECSLYLLPDSVFQIAQRLLRFFVDRKNLWS